MCWKVLALVRASGVVAVNAAALVDDEFLCVEEVCKSAAVVYASVYVADYSYYGVRGG